MRHADELSMTIDAGGGEPRRELARRRGAGGEQARRRGPTGRRVAASSTVISRAAPRQRRAGRAGRREVADLVDRERCARRGSAASPLRPDLWRPTTPTRMVDNATDRHRRSRAGFRGRLCSDFATQSAIERGPVRPVRPGHLDRASIEGTRPLGHRARASRSADPGDSGRSSPERSPVMTPSGPRRRVASVASLGPHLGGTRSPWRPSPRTGMIRAGELAAPPGRWIGRGRNTTSFGPEPAGQRCGARCELQFRWRTGHPPHDVEQAGCSWSRSASTASRERQLAHRGDEPPVGGADGVEVAQLGVADAPDRRRSSSGCARSPRRDPPGDRLQHLMRVEAVHLPGQPGRQPPSRQPRADTGDADSRRARSSRAAAGTRRPTHGTGS